MKGLQLFDNFVESATEEPIVYVQPILFRSDNHSSSRSLNSEDLTLDTEKWHCLLTPHRFVICKSNNEGIIIKRKQLIYENIKHFKLKKNKRFKKSNLPSIKIYLSNSNNSPMSVLTDDEDSYGTDRGPKIVISFQSNEAKDTFYQKMLSIINSANVTNDGNETLETVIFRQNLLNQYLSLKSENENESFRFLGVLQSLTVDITDITNEKYYKILSFDDRKYMTAFYNTKQSTFAIRNNRKEWVLNVYFATKLYESYMHKSGSNISDECKWVWVKQLCRASIHFVTDSEMNKKLKILMDLLIRSIFAQKYIKPLDTFFHEKDYQNLQILLHLCSNYISSSNLKKINLRLRNMIPLLLCNAAKNKKYKSYFVHLCNISQLQTQMKETDIYQSIVCYIDQSQSKAIVSIHKDSVLQTLLKILKFKNFKKIYPQTQIYLQEIICKNSQNIQAKSEDLVLAKLKISLIIDGKLLFVKHNGMSVGECAQKHKNIFPNVFTFLQNEIGTRQLQTTVDNKTEQKNDGNTLANDKNNKKFIFSENEICADTDHSQEGKVVRKKHIISPPQTHEQTSIFSSFIGQCFSWSGTAEITVPSHSGNSLDIDGSESERQLQQRLQSCMMALEKFKTKNRSLEHKIAKMNKNTKKQNEKIIELKLENKMLRNVFNINTKEVSAESDSDGSEIESVNKKKWRNWSHLQIISWICSLQNGRFKKYRNTLKINLKLRNIKGVHLARMDKSDLTYFYGIIDFEDVNELYTEITNLINKSPHND